MYSLFRGFLVTILALNCAFAVRGPAGAQTVRPLPATQRHGVAPVPVAPAVPSGVQHTVFGTIARLAKSSFVLQMRTGRRVSVDAAPAIASGRYSAPLFVGKFVVVEGTLDASGTLHARSVTRMTRLDGATPRDK
jgi:hypothetical protein